MGVFPIDVEAAHIDALAADGHKWMLGPEGNGVLYVRRKWLDAIEPVEFGWTNPANYADYSSRDMTLRADAGRYECGTLNTVGCFGHRASLEFLLEVGIPNVGAAVMARATQLDEGLRALGYEVMIRTHPSQRLRHRLLPPSHHRFQNDGQLKCSRNKITAAPRQGWVRAVAALLH